MAKKPKEFTTRTKSGAPSICVGQFSATFKTKDQCAAFIEKVFALDLNLYPSFSFEETNLGGEPRYSVSMEYVWANNLVRFAELLAEVDFQEC